MQAAQDGFRHLYREHYAFVWHTVRRFGVPDMFADDAVQDTFITAFRRGDDFDGRSPRAWLYCIGRRVASNHWRARVRREQRQRDSAGPASLAAPSEERLCAQQTVAGFLRQLSAADRELFVLSEVDGLTGPELASVLGRKMATIYGRIRVLRGRFREFARDDPAALREVEGERPRPSSAGWLALQPWLTASASSAATAGVLTTTTALWGTVVGSAGVVALVAATATPSPPGPAAEPSNAPAAVVSNPTLQPTSHPVATAADPGLETVPPPKLPPSIARPPAGPAAAKRRPAARRPPTTDAPPPPSPGPGLDLAADTRRLREAQVALREAQPQRALEHLQTHERLFPRSGQADLRAALQIEARCALGQEAGARELARQLARTSPGTPMLARVEETCAGKP